MKRLVRTIHMAEGHESIKHADGISAPLEVADLLYRLEDDGREKFIGTVAEINEETNSILIWNSGNEPNPCA